MDSRAALLPRIAWAACERPDWMLWLLARTGARREDLVRVACDCARFALALGRWPGGVP